MTDPRHENGEARVYRLAVGFASLALSGMLVYGAYRLGRIIIPRYGPEFFYVPVIMVGLAVWMAVRGVLTLRGRDGGA
ncbi:MAG: hypothetical protein GF405_05995 [Candidatus Eisenbacteria bacterium]|nr:hypothetical protein [Candidatus Eisenbacteria bacterium]